MDPGAVSRAAAGVTELSLEEVARRANAGDVQAQGVFLEWLRAMASRGSRDAKRAVAQVLVTRPPYGIEEAASAALASAAAGDPDAAHLVAMMAAEGYGMPQDWRVALD